MERKNLNHPMIRILWKIDGPNDLSTEHFDEYDFGFTNKDYIMVVLVMWIIGCIDMLANVIGEYTLLTVGLTFIKWVIAFAIGYVMAMHFVYKPDFQKIYRNISEKEMEQEKESKNKTSN